MKSPFHFLLIIGALSLLYFGAFIAFHRAHMEVGVRNMRSTEQWLSVEDTPLNRILVSFFSPLKSIGNFQEDLEWIAPR